MKTGMTQKERSAATRRKLLDAAAKILITRGYAGLTTTTVCKAAGVSQGALFKHYGSKMNLLGALAEDLYSGLAQRFEALFNTIPPGADLIRESIRHLWTVFSSPEQLATYDLTAASRTDPLLRETLDDIVLEHRHRIRQIATTLHRQMGVPEDRFNALADIILIAVQGMVINRLAYPEKDSVDSRLAFLETIAKTHIQT